MSEVRARVSRAAGATRAAFFERARVVLVAGVLDRDLVEQDCVRLGQKVRGDDGEKRREAVLVVDQRIGESQFGGAAARSDQQIDMSDFITFADERLADHELVDQGHLLFLSQNFD